MQLHRVCAAAALLVLLAAAAAPVLGQPVPAKKKSDKHHDGKSPSLTISQNNNVISYPGGSTCTLGTNAVFIETDSCPGSTGNDATCYNAGICQNTMPGQVTQSVITLVCVITAERCGAYGPGTISMAGIAPYGTWPNSLVVKLPIVGGTGAFANKLGMMTWTNKQFTFDFVS